MGRTLLRTCIKDRVRLALHGRGSLMTPVHIKPDLVVDNAIVVPNGTLSNLASLLCLPTVSNDEMTQEGTTHRHDLSSRFLLPAALREAFSTFDSSSSHPLEVSLGLIALRVPPAAIIQLAS